jgi:hypothetical protein
MKNKTQTSTVIMIAGIHDAALATRIYQKVSETLERVDPPPTRAKIIFADENGPKGGVGIRCTIVSDMPRRRDLSVTELGDTYELAWDAAYEAFDTSITRDRTRRRDLVRRPKKYFLAKRLLSPDATLPPTEVLSESQRPKRARRRRAA